MFIKAFSKIYHRSVEMKYAALDVRQYGRAQFFFHLLLIGLFRTLVLIDIFFHCFINVYFLLIHYDISNMKYI